MFQRLFKLKWDNVTKAALISFFSALYFYTPFLTLYELKRGLNFLQINSLWGFIVGTMLFTEIPTGILADKLGRKTSIFIGLALQVIGEVGFVYANNYLLFVLISIIAGLGFSFSFGCFDAIIYDTLKEKGQEENAAKSMGGIKSYSQLANIIAPAIGGLLVTSFTIAKFQTTIILTAIAVAIALLISIFLREPHIPFAHAKKKSNCLGPRSGLAKSRETQ